SPTRATRRDGPVWPSLLALGDPKDTYRKQVTRWRETGMDRLMPRARSGHGSALALLVALACWISIAPWARATSLAPLLLQQTLWAAPIPGDPTPKRTPSSAVGTLPGTFVVDDGGAA